VAGCATPVEEGMKVITQSAKVREARKAVMEFLLIHHPLDCPMCDKGGECTLQDYTMMMGPASTRFTFEKQTWPEEDVGGKLILNKNRCILCLRCVNLCKTVAGRTRSRSSPRRETYIGTVGGRDDRERDGREHRGHLPGRRAHEQGLPLPRAALGDEARRSPSARSAPRGATRGRLSPAPERGRTASPRATTWT
jgi:ferredoxin